MMRRSRKNSATAVALTAVIGGMVALSFASVPLYRLFCQVTGYGGTPNIAAAAAVEISTHRVDVRFDANVNSSLPWRFGPAQREMRVRLGEPVLAFYKAKNVSDEPLTGTATFNVTPFKVGRYFSKLDCFCFSEQRLLPGEEVDMAVSFFVDPALLSDPDTRDVGSITLSYTFFRAMSDGEAEGG